MGSSGGCHGRSHPGRQPIVRGGEECHYGARADWGRREAAGCVDAACEPTGRSAGGGAVTTAGGGRGGAVCGGRGGGVGGGGGGRGGRKKPAPPPPQRRFVRE